MLCESCKTTPSTIYCRADSAFLCASCDAKIHAANKLSTRHARVLVCEVCEQSPAAVTCKADAAALCAACDRDIHSANPLARRHERVPVTPFYDSASFSKSSEEFSEEEVEAASWLLPNPNFKLDDDSTDSPEYNNNSNNKSVEYLFNHDNHMGPYLDLDLMSGVDEQKPTNLHNFCELKNKLHYFSSDGVVPSESESGFEPGPVQGQVVDGFPTYDVEYHAKPPFMYKFGSSQSMSQSVSSSSLEIGVVPDHNAATDMTNTFATNEIAPTPLSGLDREARVMRYREKRKNRKFEKTIRYASRKAYAETRPRIKGRFAKRSELEVDAFITTDASYGVVPSF